MNGFAQPRSLNASYHRTSNTYAARNATTVRTFVASGCVSRRPMIVAMIAMPYITGQTIGLNGGRYMT